MAKTAKLNDTELVSQHIAKLDAPAQKAVLQLRQIILSANKEIAECIKWNNPTFYYTGPMNPFDPKEFKNIIIVFNLFKNRLMLVFPSGAKVKDAAGLLEGNYKDGRRVAIFKDVADIKEKEQTLKKLINDWISLVDE